MIRSEVEYREALRRIGNEKRRLAAQRKSLAAAHSTAEVSRLLQPARSFLRQLQEEVESYERLRRGEFDEIHNLRGLGELLIGLRIFKGLSQKELADRLGTHESQVSRDERNEYHNITLERANRVLEALEVELVSIVRAEDAMV